MKEISLLFLFSLTQINGLDLSYAGVKGVIIGCKSDCCCPEEGSLVFVEKIYYQEDGEDRLQMMVEEGSWSEVCAEVYGYDSDSYVMTLPFNDKTKIDPINGVDIEYEDVDGNQILWTWFPSVARAEEKAPGIKIGDPIVTFTSKQGSITGCTFIMGAFYLKLSLIILVSFLLFILF